MNSAHYLFIILASGYLLYIAQGILIPLILSIFLWYIIDTMAFGINGLTKKLFKVEHRGLSLTLALLFNTFLIWLIFYIITQNVGTFIAKSPEYSQQLRNLLLSLTTKYDIDAVQIVNNFFNELDLHSLFSSIISSVTGIVKNFGIILLYVLFMFLEQKNWRNKITALEKSSKKKALSKTINNISGRLKIFMLIKTLEGLATGIVGYIIMRLLNIEFAAFWAVLMFILNYIPNIGAIVSCIPPILIALAQYSLGWQFWVATTSLVAMQFIIGNILEPRIMGRNLNLSPLILMLSLLVWGALWGIMGMFLCIPMTVSVLIILAQFPKTKNIAILLSDDGQV